MFTFFFIIIILIIIFYVSNKYILKKNIKEHYLTYFLPYYNNEKNVLANFYKNNENNLNYFKKKFNYDIIKYGIIKNDFTYVRDVLSEYISKSNLYKAEILMYTDKLQGLDDLLNNRINFNLNNYSTITHYTDVLNKNIDNLRLITTLYNLYIYIFTKKKYNIFSINNLPYKIKIGILNYPEAFFLYSHNFLRDLGYKENIDYTLNIYNTFDELIKGFINEECNIIIIEDVFPNNKIKIFLDNNIVDEIILLPFNIVKEELFLKKNPSIIIDYIDLNLLSASYLPKKFENNEYSKNKPNLKIAYKHKILLSNKNTDPKYTYSIIKFFRENWKYLNSNTPIKGYEISGIEIDNNKIGYLDYHEGVLNYFYDIGLITNIDNDNCKYLIGKMSCNEKNLKNNNLLEYNLL